MSLSRLTRHLFTPAWRVQKNLSAAALDRIEKAIRDAELKHGGQIRFAVEHALEPVAVLQGESAGDRALEVFSLLRVWDTEHNNGGLIYLLFADRDVEIVADRGIHARVGHHGWEEICREMEAAFRTGQFEEGIISGIDRVSRHLETHFARGSKVTNELPDRPVVL